jgi:hypothetical protein
MQPVSDLHECVREKFRELWQALHDAPTLD